MASESKSPINMLDLDEVLDSIGVGKYHVLQALLLAGPSIAEGSEMLVASSILGALEASWGISPAMKGVMMSIVFVGVLFGGLVGGAWADSVGRCPVILAAYVGILLFGGLTALTWGPRSMLVCRFFFGMAYGAGCGPIVALLLECAPSKARAHLVNLGNLWFAIGEVYSALLLFMLMPSLGDYTGYQWRYVTALAIVPALVLLPGALCLLQESPHYLTTKGRHEDAIAAVRYIASLNNTEARGLFQEAALEATDQRFILNDAGNDGGQEEKQMTLSERLEFLAGPQLLMIVVGGGYLCFFANFMVFGLNYSLPQIFTQMGDQVHPTKQLLMSAICDIPGYLLAFFCISSRSYGHRDSLLVNAICVCVLQLVIASCDVYGLQNWTMVVLPCAYLSKYFVSCFFALSYIYLGEVFPSSCRCTALAVCISMGRVGSMFSPIAYEALRASSRESAKNTSYFCLNAALSALAVLAIRWCLRYELKGRPLGTVPETFARRNSAPARLMDQAVAAAKSRASASAPVRSSHGVLLSNKYGAMA
mmetsp:Transcript_33149/g.91356  ORF Transcript_33149/g.91356 Transcript_33149/m.91356 type:complete len:536 (+) Transcript_33149:46-1653(+)